MQVILTQDEWYPVIERTDYDSRKKGPVEISEELNTRWVAAKKEFMDVQLELARAVTKWEEINNDYYF